MNASDSLTLAGSAVASASIPRPPSSPGGTLQTHHFQGIDRYAEDRLAFVMATFAPYAWGFSELHVDPSAVTKGVLRVARAVGRFPSGLAFDIRHLKDSFERELPPSFSARSEITAFLAIARPADDAPNVTSQQNTPFAVRYSLGASDTPSLKPILRIVFDDEELPANVDRLPIARLRRKGVKVEFDRTFVPPMVRMLAGTEAATNIDTLVTELKRRERALVASRRGNAADVDPSRYPQLRLLSLIGEAIGSLIYVNVRGQPDRLYLKLAALLGALEPLAGIHDPIPEFTHEDPGPAFREVLMRLHAVVPTVAPDPYVQMPLQRRDASTFHVTASDVTVLRSRLLLVATGPEPRALSAHVAAYAKICAPSHFDYVVQNAVPGVRLGVEFDAPAAISTSVADVCFRLEQRGDYWDEIAKSGTLLLFLNQAPADLTFTLYAVPER